jgi:hypothetical protein
VKNWFQAFAFKCNLYRYREFKTSYLHLLVAYGEVPRQGSQFNNFSPPPPPPR